MMLYEKPRLITLAADAQDAAGACVSGISNPAADATGCQVGVSAPNGPCLAGTGPGSGAYPCGDGNTPGGGTYQCLSGGSAGNTPTNPACQIGGGANPGCSAGYSPVSGCTTGSIGA
jgi:hypothetical protein